MERQCVKRHMWHRGTKGLWSSSRYPCLWTVGLSSGEWRSRAAKLQCGPVPHLLCGVGKQGWRGIPGERAAIRIYIFIRDQSYVLFLSLFSLLFPLSCIHMLEHAEVSYFTVSELDCLWIWLFLFTFISFNIFSHLLLLYLIFLDYMQRGSKSTYENAKNELYPKWVFVYKTYVCVLCIFIIYIYTHQPLY